MRAILTAVVAAIEAAAVALAGLVLVAVPAALLWVLTFDLAAQPIEVLGGAIAVWALAHFAPLSFSVTAETALGLGLPAEALTVPFSLPPLGITLLTAALAARMGWRFAQRGGTGAAGVLGGTIGFVAVASLVLPFAQGIAPQPIWQSVTLAGLVFLIPAGVAYTTRAAVEEQGWWAATLRLLRRGLEKIASGAAILPDLAAETIRIAAAALSALIGLGGLGFAVSLTLGYVEITALAQGLQLDPLGAALIFLLQLALLPVAIIWGISWFTGSGFSIGSGTSVSPFETLLGPLPSLPIMGAMPRGWGDTAALAPAVIVLLGLGIGLLATRRSRLRTGSWTTAVLLPVFAGALAGLGVAALSVLASGAIGPERLAVTGPHPWITGGLAAAEIGGGLLLGVCAGRIGLARMRTALASRNPSVGDPAEHGIGERGFAEYGPDEHGLAEHGSAAGWSADDHSPQELTQTRVRRWAERVRGGVAGIPGALGIGAGKNRAHEPRGSTTDHDSLATLDLSDALDAGTMPATDGAAENDSTENGAAGDFATEEFDTAAGTEKTSAVDEVDAADPADEAGEADEADALLRAYSWDGPPDIEDPPSEKRGWRPPWRSR